MTHTKPLSYEAFTLASSNLSRLSDSFYVRVKSQQ